jgi:indolepyruvate decarboxylase
VVETVAKASGGDPETAKRNVVASIGGIPTGRFTTPEEIPTLVVLLARSRTANVTGADYVTASRNAYERLISGSLPLRAVQRGDLMHHTLADREKGNFCRRFAEVTGAQARLTPENAAVEIDRLILTAWRNKVPVYLELPSDIAYLEIAVPEAPLELAMMPSEPQSLAACTEMILRRLRAAKSPAFLLDLDAIRFGIAGRIMDLAERFHIQVATLNCAKGAVPETSSHYIGTYAGIGSARATREAIEGSDCPLTVGYRPVESTSGFFTAKLPASAIHLNSDHVETAFSRSLRTCFTCWLTRP